MWCAATSSPLSLLRLQNVYGPGQSLSNEGAGVLAHFVRVAMSGAAIDVFEDGGIRRDFVYIDDAVAALTAAIAAPPDDVRTVDVGFGRSHTLLDVARAIAASADAPPPVVSGRFRDGDIRAAGCDITAAEVELGYARRGH